MLSLFALFLIPALAWAHETAQGAVAAANTTAGVIASAVCILLYSFLHIVSNMSLKSLQHHTILHNTIQ